MKYMKGSSFKEAASRKQLQGSSSRKQLQGSTFIYEFITSNDRAIWILRKLMMDILLTILMIIGAKEFVLAILQAIFQAEEYLDKQVILLGLSGILIFYFFLSVYTYYDNRWAAHLTPIEIEPYEKLTFMDSKVYVRNNHFFPTSDFNLEYVLKRSMSVYGMSKKQFIYTNMTLGVEYARNSLIRIYKMYERVGRFGNRITSRHDFYQAMINTSMICWMNVDSGHLEFTNMRLVYNQTDVIDIPYCSIELDHESQKFVAMFIEMEDGKGLQEVVDENPETCEEAAVLAMFIFSTHSHTHVHYWANGVGQLINAEKESSWQLAEESNTITQWMNHSATFTSWFYTGTTSGAMASLISNNMKQGLPMHFHGKYMKKVALQSKTHLIQKTCKQEIRQLHPEWPESVITSLIAATVFHAGDHYYTDKYLSFAYKSSYLKTDFSFHRISLIGANKYYTRSLKCCERLDDPICKIIYEAALKYDEDFAHEVTFACAN